MLSAQEQIKFDDFFVNKTLRFDYTRAGDKDTAMVFFEQLKQEPFWGGSHKNLIDKFDLGDYKLQVFDSISGQLIYSRGYSSLFPEWQETPEAKKLNRSFYESVVMPFPKNTVRLVLQERNRKNIFLPDFEIFINPLDYSIVKGNIFQFKTEKVYDSGNPAQKLDIVIIPEGYTEAEMAKYHTDSERFIKQFFKVSPFKEHADKVNFWTIDATSAESGTDIPGDSIWRNTILNTHFYTFYSERYLTTQDIKRVRDLAALVPYDQIYILVNTTKYGGGGVFNYYNLCSSDHKYSEQVFTHEFGHAFAALADEYAYEDSPAEERYDLSVETWQVNISTLADFDKKWKHLVDKNTPIPTPVTKKNIDKIGAFEGAGYVKKKIFRPTYNCKMRSNSTDEFCPVCHQAVLELLLFYSK